VSLSGVGRRVSAGPWGAAPAGNGAMCKGWPGSAVHQRLRGAETLSHPEQRKSCERRPVGWRTQRPIGCGSWLCSHRPSEVRASVDAAPARPDGPALARRLRLDSVRGSGTGERAGGGPSGWPRVTAALEPSRLPINASRASAGPWGGAHDSRAGALHGRVLVVPPRSAPASTQRQPAGTGRRSHGAFGLIPCGKAHVLNGLDMRAAVHTRRVSSHHPAPIASESAA